MKGLKVMRKQQRKLGLCVLIWVIGFVLLTGCGGVEKNIDFEEEKVNVTIGVARTGGLLTGMGKMKIYVDGQEVFTVKNDDTVYHDMMLHPGVHSIQAKGQGDKSKEVEFEVVTGKEQRFVYNAEISNFIGVDLERVE
jgi:hypothetical protein